MHVEEDAAAFEVEDSRPAPVGAPFEGANGLRRIAGIGPAYEVLEDRGDFVRVRVVHDGEEFDYRRADAMLDPPA